MKNSRTFNRILHDAPTFFFKDFTTDLHLKIQLHKCSLSYWRNEYKIVVPLFGAADAAPNKGIVIFLLFLVFISRVLCLLKKKSSTFQGHRVILQHFSR